MKKEPIISREYLSEFSAKVLRNYENGFLSHSEFKRANDTILEYVNLSDEQFSKLRIYKKKLNNPVGIFRYLWYKPLTTKLSIIEHQYSSNNIPSFDGLGGNLRGSKLHKRFGLRHNEYGPSREYISRVLETTYSLFGRNMTEDEVSMSVRLEKLMNL